MHVLLVEDDQKLATGIVKNLAAEQFIIEAASDGIEGEHMAMVNRYDAILLDIRLPKQDGWETCARLRRQGCTTPILMLTAQADVSDKIRGLNTGADDYLTKPFHMGELVARIRALVRRQIGNRANILEIAGVTLDMTSHRATRNGLEISLTNKEFALLELFMLNPGKVITRERIMESLWDMNFDPRSNIVEAFIKLLRQKMDKGFSKPLIHTMRGTGYVFSETGH